MIDQEVRKLIDDAYIKTKELLTEKRGDVEKLADELLLREVLFQSDVEALIGKRPFEEKKSLVEEKKDELVKDAGEISAGVPPYDSDVTNKSLP
jgi:cell division protease FtsH